MNPNFNQLQGQDLSAYRYIGYQNAACKTPALPENLSFVGALEQAKRGAKVARAHRILPGFYYTLEEYKGTLDAFVMYNPERECFALPELDYDDLCANDWKVVP